MKTPKKTRIFTAKCPICGWSSPVNIKAGAPDTLIQCNFCDAQWLLQASNNPSNAFYARWKRKNRETQSKRTIARLTRLVRELEWEAAYWHSQTLCTADIADKFRAATENAGACGHDIEGS